MSENINPMFKKTEYTSLSKPVDVKVVEYVEIAKKPKFQFGMVEIITVLAAGSIMFVLGANWVVSSLMSI